MVLGPGVTMDPSRPGATSAKPGKEQTVAQQARARAGVQVKRRLKGVRNKNAFKPHKNISFIIIF